MTTTFLLEELDQPTREYLLAVRADEGRGAPGVFAAAANQWPTLGCIFGPILILGTLFFTLNTGMGIVYDDPTRVALLQTAGLLLGGWMLVAALRVWARNRSEDYAGHWVYADALHFYVAKGEQVKVTPLVDMIRATVTHHLNNQKYQHSMVELRFPGNAQMSVKLTHEGRAEQLIAFLNYLAWSRGPEGGDRGDLPPAVLGGVARYVAKNDQEPLGANYALNLDLVQVEITNVPEDPQRDRRAIPRVLAYVVMLPLAVICVFVMAEVNIPFRDDAIYQAVTQPPMEPRFLRAYLIDPRNTLHRQEVTDRLAPFYNPVINSVRTQAQNETLKKGFIEILESLRRADQPVVSLRATETKSPPGKEAGAVDRAKKLAEGLALATNDEFGRIAPAIQPPQGVVFPEPPPPLGHQLIAFAAAPDDAPHSHFDVAYAFEPDQGGYQVTAKVTIRVAVDADPVATATLTLPGQYTPEKVDAAVNDLKERLMRDMVGVTAKAAINPLPGGIPFPPIPKGDW
jgi:hypothetical protein